MTTPDELDVAALRERLSSDTPPTVVDVRTPPEFAGGHIPGSRNVPLDQLAARRAELPADLVLVCRSGPRAEQARRQLAAAGVTAPVLTGGLAAWTAAGAPAQRAAGGRRVWDMDRQVRFTAGVLVLLGLLGYLIVPVLLWFSALIATALVVTATLGICPMAVALGRMPWNRAPAPPAGDRLAAGSAG